MLFVKNFLASKTFQRTIGMAASLLLSACASKPKPPPIPLAADQPFYTQKMDVAPWPWVKIIPSERAAQFEEINFAFISRLLRHNIAIHPEKFSKISLILIDYAILPETPPDAPTYAADGISFCEKYILMPEHYFLEIRFYEENKRPPEPPLYMGTIVMTPRTAPLLEAIRHMMDVLLFELGCYSARRLHIRLDAGSGGKKIVTPSSPPPKSQKETSPKKKTPEKESPPPPQKSV